MKCDVFGHALISCQYNHANLIDQVQHTNLSTATSYKPPMACTYSKIFAHISGGSATKLDVSDQPQLKDYATYRERSI